MMRKWTTPADIVEIMCIKGKAVEVSADMVRIRDQVREVCEDGKHVARYGREIYGINFR